MMVIFFGGEQGVPVVLYQSNADEHLSSKKRKAPRKAQSKFISLLKTRNQPMPASSDGVHPASLYGDRRLQIYF